MKRRSQTYHSFFKSPEKHNRNKEKSKKSRSHRFSNPFIPAGMKIMESMSSEDSSQIEYHILCLLAETRHSVTHKVVNLKNGDPLIAKTFKVCLPIMIS